MQNLEEFLWEKLSLQNDNHVTTPTSPPPPPLLHLPTGIKQLLTRLFIVANQTKIEPPRLEQNLDHKLVIDECVKHLVRKRLLCNVLTHGYSPDQTGEVNKHLFCKSGNSNVLKLKGFPWDVIHRVIGTENFVDMLLNYTVIEFCEDQFVQIVGNEGNLPHVPPSWVTGTTEPMEPPKFVSNRTFLHKSFGKYNHKGILSLDIGVKDLGGHILGSSLDDIGFTAGQAAQLDVIVRKIIRNNRRKINYFRILNLTCPQWKQKKLAGIHHLERATNVQAVLRFVIIVLEKLLPRELYGTKRNKATIFKYVNRLLRLPLNGSFHLGVVVSQVKLEDIPWINKSKNTLENVLSWIYTTLVPQIIIRFFYCTEISSDTEILYFRREVWNDMVKNFLSVYMQRYLTLNHKCRNHSSYTLSSWNHCHPRIIPKSAKNEFRMITVPNRGFDHEENVAFTNNMYSVILPVRYILIYLRRGRPLTFAKLHSTADIAKAMIEFKQGLLNKYGSLPKLHYMKFDIASCYDTVPREKLVKVLQNLVKDETGFFVRAYHVFDPHRRSLKRKYTVNGTLGPKIGLNTVTIDGSRTFHFSTKEFMDVIEHVLYRTTLQIGDNCFFRKDGLFQGDSLSSLLVDILYDDLLDHFMEFTPRRGEDCLVLRLADDFLVISTDQFQIEAIKKLARQGFGEYNATVKREKILASGSQSGNSDIVVFCALHICIFKLEMIKHKSTMKIPRLSALTATELYSRLEWLLNQRLNYGTLDLRLNSSPTIISQARNIVGNIAETLVQIPERRLLEETAFLNFVNYITNAIDQRCRHAQDKNDLDFYINVRLSIIDTFLGTFMNTPSRFENLIRCLRDMRRHIK